MSSKPYIKVSEHAFDRLRERSGLNRSAANKLVVQAFTKGLKHGETVGRLFKWVSSASRTSRTGSTYRVYGDKLYIFSPDYKEENTFTLVTVMQVPSNLSNIVKVSREKKSKNHSGEHT